MTVSDRWRICFEFRRGDASRSLTTIEVEIMAPVVHPGRLLKRELSARKLSANRLALDIGVPSGRITDILNGRRAITADTAVRLGRYFGNKGQFWLDLQGQYDIGVVEREKGAEIARRVRPADAA
jgi:antitoxin HigA-1